MLEIHDFIREIGIVPGLGEKLTLDLEGFPEEGAGGSTVAFLLTNVSQPAKGYTEVFFQVKNLWLCGHKCSVDRKSFLEELPSGLAIAFSLRQGAKMVQ